MLETILQVALLQPMWHQIKKLQKSLEEASVDLDILPEDVQVNEDAIQPLFEVTQYEDY